ncbi:MAG: iron-containing alcohol dehydrogenase [Parabacteroides sp.]|nr:iron-containing alcohol dehydrogenase [Parabacteroides sp.]
MAKLFGTKELYHGIGSLEELKNIEGKKAVIVIGGSSVKKNGSLQKVEDILKNKGFEVTVFSGVEADPSIDTVRKGAQLFMEFCPDWIIGLGGCSAIDAAKAMWAIYEHPELSFEQMTKIGGIPPLRNKAKFVAIPSTSGTGTEITALAVITDRENNVKYPLVSYELLPDLSIVDGELCKSMPASVTANTGLDALTHCVEAYVSNIDDNYADALAKGGIELIFKNLPVAVTEPENETARQNMHDASCLGGYAFTNAWLGIAHSMAHQIGANFGIPHGCVNAIVLPTVIRYNMEATDRYDDLARLLGKTTGEEFAQAVEDLRKQVNVIGSVREAGVSEEDWNKVLDEMAEHAFADPCTGFNPRKTSVEDLKQLLMSVY